MNQKIPSFTKDQVEYLNAIFPERCPNSKMEERDIWRYVGSRELVRHINQAYAEQMDRAMAVQAATSAKSEGDI